MHLSWGCEPKRVEKKEKHFLRDVPAPLPPKSSFGMPLYYLNNFRGYFILYIIVFVKKFLGIKLVLYESFL